MSTNVPHLTAARQTIYLVSFRGTNMLVLIFIDYVFTQYFFSKVSLSLAILED